MSERITDNLSSDIHEAWMDLQRLENSDERKAWQEGYNDEVLWQMQED